jgi:hypothetical protein
VKLHVLRKWDILWTVEVLEGRVVLGGMLDYVSEVSGMILATSAAIALDMP